MTIAVIARLTLALWLTLGGYVVSVSHALAQLIPEPSHPAPVGELQGLAGVGGVVVVTGLVASVKGIITNEKWWPVLALLFGVAWGTAVAVALHTDVGIGAMLGVPTGLAASGLWSGAKTVLRSGLGTN